MGITCTLILLDEFDWGYLNTDKEKKAKEFIEEFGRKDRDYYPELVAQWYGAMVFDIDKLGYCSDERKAIIMKYCDSAYYILDCAMCKIEKLE
jgi:hypothetical protein